MHKKELEVSNHLRNEEKGMSGNSIFHFEAGRNAHLYTVSFSAKIQLLSKACTLFSLFFYCSFTLTIYTLVFPPACDQSINNRIK